MATLWLSPGMLDQTGKLLQDLRTPAFVVQKSVMERNCQRMLQTCERLGLKLRAQTKTHKTVEGATMQTGGSKKGLVCSTLDECELFADAGFDDILFGHPFIEHHLKRVERLTEKLDEFQVMLDSKQSAQLLVDNLPPTDKKYSVFLKVDCGKGRAGVWHEDLHSAAEIIKILAECSHIIFRGVYVHCGDTYHATSTSEVDKIRDNNIARLLLFEQKIKEMTGVKCTTLGVGSTPSCCRPSDDMKQLTELHPGNYAFLDLQQQMLGSCTEEDIAGSVLTSVIGHYPRRNQLLVDCGFTALTKQGFGKMNPGYGKIKGHSNLKLGDMDQEHGFVEPIDQSEKLDYSKYPVGSKLQILPYHSCATAAMFSTYQVVENNIVTEVWRPTRGW